MKVLAFDTSTEYCSLALWLDGEIRNREVLAGQRHSELLLPLLNELLEEAGLKLAQMDGIAFGAGPGSFTGLRIACGVAQGLAFGMNVPVIGISTLEALAQQTGDANVIVAIDARMSEIYHAAYTKSVDGWQVVSAPALCLPQQAPTMSGINWTGCGSGFAKYDETLRSRYQGSIRRIAGDLSPRAREIVQLAVPRFLGGLALDPADAAPFYIRNKVALKESKR